MKKLLLIFSFAMLAICQSAFAYDFSAVAPSGQTLYYNITSATTVECVPPGGNNGSGWSGYTKPSGSLIIPSTVTNLGVTYIVKSLSNHAFSSCSTLTRITIPNTVKEIKESAFSLTTNLDTITLPNTGILFGNYTLKETGWYRKQTSGLVYLGNVLVGYKGQIPANYSVIVPSNIISISGGAFSNESNVVSVSLPNSLEYIGEAAFYNCNITSVVLPYSLKGIGQMAFSGTHISSVTIPNNVEYIGSWAFYQCGSLTTVNYNATNALIGAYSPLYTYVGCPFDNCQNLSSITFGNNVQIIPEKLFSGCSNISGTLTLPNSIQTICDYAFKNCSGITGTLSLPNSLQSIGQGAFQGCSGITGNLQINNSVHIIGYMSFYECTGITSITIGTSVDSIGSAAFEGMTSLTTINYNAINCDYAPGVFSVNTISNFNIGSNVQTIPDEFISSSPNLTSVSFPNTLTRIGSMNFAGCGLSGIIELPASLTNIGYGAFNGCNNITGIQCNAITPPTIESLNGVSIAFNNGNWNTALIVPCSSISDYQAAAGWNYFSNISGIGGCNYTVTLSVNNSTMGSVSGGGTYTQGETATISAIANNGYRFDYWSDGNTQNPRYITVTNDISLMAYFVDNPVMQYTITVNSNNVAMGSASGGGTFDEGTNTTISAIANNGYYFTHWQDGNTSNHRIITVTGDATYTAYFEALQGIDEIENSRVKIEVYGLAVAVENPDGETVRIYDIVGRMLQTTNSQLSTTNLPTSGVYIVKVAGLPARKIVVVR